MRKTKFYEVKNTALAFLPSSLNSLTCACSIEIAELAKTTSVLEDD